MIIKNIEPKKQFGSIKILVIVLVLSSIIFLGAHPINEVDALFSQSNTIHLDKTAFVSGNHLMPLILYVTLIPTSHHGFLRNISDFVNDHWISMLIIWFVFTTIVAVLASIARISVASSGIAAIAGWIPLLVIINWLLLNPMTH